VRRREQAQELRDEHVGGALHRTAEVHLQLGWRILADLQGISAKTLADISSDERTQERLCGVNSAHHHASLREQTTRKRHIFTAP